MVLSQKVIDFYVNEGVGHNSLSQKCQLTMSSMSSEDVLFHRELQERTKELGYPRYDKENNLHWKRNCQAIHLPSLSSGDYVEKIQECRENIRVVEERVAKKRREVLKKRRELERKIDDLKKQGNRYGGKILCCKLYCDGHNDRLPFDLETRQYIHYRNGDCSCPDCID